MDIVLVNSVNFSEDNNAQQLGLLSLEKILKEVYAVKIVNFDELHEQGIFNYSDDVDDNLNRMADYIVRISPLAIGFYTICNTYPITIALAKRIRKKMLSTSIVFGGPQASLTAEESLKSYPFVDVIAIGEGERNITDLMKALINGTPLSSIYGIAYRDNDNIKVSLPPPIISGKELKNYTVLDRDHLVKSNKGEMCSIEAGRGCPYGCSFCSTSIFWGRNFRIKPVKDIVSELKYLNKKYGISKFRLEHDLLTANKKYIVEICEALQSEDWHIQWGCSSRIDTLDEEITSKLLDAGCNSIYIGFETGSARMQKILKKNLPVEKADERLVRLRKSGFELTVSFIYGFYDEKEEDFLDTIHLIEKLYTNDIYKVQLHKFIPLPQTEETFKMEEELYMEWEDADISIYQRSRNNQEINKIISEQVKIHSCFYTFQNDMRNKYKHIDVLITCLSFVFKQFGISVKYIVQNYGLLDIYEKCNSEIKNCYNEIQELSLTSAYRNKNTNQLWMGLYITIIKQIEKSVEKSEIREIVKYETDLYNFAYVMKEMNYQREYFVDIYSSVKEKKIVGGILTKPQTIFFSRRGNKISISQGGIKTSIGIKGKKK